MAMIKRLNGEIVDNISPEKKDEDWAEKIEHAMVSKAKNMDELVEKVLGLMVGKAKDGTVSIKKDGKNIKVSFHLVEDKKENPRTG